MPELPEVETIRLQLDKVLRGRRIEKVEILNKKSFLGEKGEVEGKKVLGVRRRGKINLIELEKGIYLAIHLKLTGQLIFRGKGVKKTEEKEKGVFAVGELPNKFTRVVVWFDGGGRLFFNDLRMFGWIKVIRGVEGRKTLGIEEAIPELKRLGPEANDPEMFTLEYFSGILKKSSKPVKLVIMDQEKLAGVGNIYANEALFEAGILPTRQAKSLTEEEVRKLREAILKVLEKAIKHKGTSDKDEAFRQITGEKGEFQNFLQVYGKEGEKCPRCGGIIKRINLGGRGTFYCEGCQR